MKINKDHPQILGERYAQKMYNQSDRTNEFLQVLGERVVSYYQRRRYDKVSPDHRKVRAFFRTTAAVLQHAAEVELAEDMLRLRRQRRDFVEFAQTIQSVEVCTRYITLVSQPYEAIGEFTGKRWDFLLISSLLSLEATKRFLDRIISEPSHWARPVFEAYRENLPAYGEITNFVRLDYDPENPNAQAYTHACENAVNSNVTILDVLTAATRHEDYRLWSQDGGPAAALGAKVGQLAWADSTSRRFFEARYKGETPRAGCPYTHDPAAMAEGNVYKSPSLRNGRWPIRGQCPASIELSSPYYDGYQNIATSELRLKSMIPIADRTLWEA